MIGHLGGAGVTDVRVVLPHDDPGGAAVAIEVCEELVERVGHVTVAQAAEGAPQQLD